MMNPTEEEGGDVHIKARKKRKSFGNSEPKPIGRRLKEDLHGIDRWGLKRLWNRWTSVFGSVRGELRKN